MEIGLQDEDWLTYKPENSGCILAASSVIVTILLEEKFCISCSSLLLTKLVTVLSFIALHITILE